MARGNSRNILRANKLVVADEFGNRGIRNLICTGVDDNVAYPLLLYSVMSSSERNEPTVILFSSEDVMNYVSLYQMDMFTVSIDSNFKYDPFCDTGAIDVGGMLSNLDSPDLKLGNNVMYIIKALKTYCDSLGMDWNSQLIATFDYDNLWKTAERDRRNGLIADYVAQDIHDDLDLGKTEMVNLLKFMKELRNQGGSLLKLKDGPAVNVKDMVKSKGALGIVVPDDSLVTSLVLQEIKENCHSSRINLNISLRSNNIYSIIFSDKYQDV